MKSAPFRVRLGEIRDAKKKAIAELIKDAVANRVRVHLLIGPIGQSKYAWAYLQTLGFTKKNYGESLLFVHCFTETVPSEDLAIPLDDIFTQQGLHEAFR